MKPQRITDFFSKVSGPSTNVSLTPPDASHATIHSASIVSVSLCGDITKSNKSSSDTHSTISHGTDALIQPTKMILPRVPPSAIEEISPTTDISCKPQDAPSQPKLAQFPQRLFGDRLRSFSASKYTDNPWLEYSLHRDAVYCFPCRHFVPATKSEKDAFCNKGYRDWKNFSNALSKHQTSHQHVSAYLRWTEFKRSQMEGTVVEKLTCGKKRQVEENRQYIKSILRCVLFCAKQNCALRGHDESKVSSNQGNFKELINLLKAESKEFAERCNGTLQSATYLSPTSQNELLNCTSRCILDRICRDFEGKDGAEWFAVIADGSRDISGHEQLSVCIRYVIDCEIRERFIGFERLHELDANSVCTSLLDRLQSAPLHVKRCVAQCYDTTPVMAGEKTGLQARFRSATGNPCFYVHCYAHKLQLCLRHCISDIPAASAFLELMNSTINFVRSSIPRSELWSQIQMKNGLDVIVLPTVCAHKWEYNHSSSEAIYKRFECLLTLLHTLSSEANLKGDDRAKIIGLYAQWTQFQNVFLLCLFRDLFSVTFPLSKVLQSTHLDLGAAMNLVAETLNILRKHRNHADNNGSSGDTNTVTPNQFHLIYKNAEDLAINSQHDIVADLPNANKRRRKEPSTLRDFHVLTQTANTVEHDAQQPQDYYKCAIYYPVLDRMLQEMRSRFSENESIIRGISACQPHNESFLKESDLRLLADPYGIDTSSLTAELLVLKAASTSQNQKWESIGDVLVFLKPLASGFTSIWRIMHLALTFPVTNVALERSFSTLRMVKFYTRSTMGQERLTSACLVSTEKGMLDNDDFLNEVRNKVHEYLF